MPAINDEEKQAFGDIRLVFEYPLTACIPSDEAKRTKLGEEYIRQQLEVLRGLIPRIRARRAALRTAVSAIMGRNMSHNIGSHVLARYSSAIKEDLKTACKEKLDHRTDFLGYLQRRMDFLAEVATADKALWAQPLSLRDSLLRLNYEKQEERFAPSEKCTAATATQPGSICKNNADKCNRLLNPTTSENKAEDKKCNKPIILSYITGKESLKASVEIGEPCWNDDRWVVKPGDGWASEREDLWFSCPGGEVGVHALYVILENIIRNSARHGTTTNNNHDPFVRLFATAERVNESKEGVKYSEELIKLTLIDPRTELDANENTPKPDGQPAKGNTEEQSDDVDENGICDTKKSLTEKINCILQHEPFLNPDGNPNTQYWGVREMQICAHYLRGFKLSDLEGTRPTPEVIKAAPYPLPQDGGHSPGYCLSYEIHLQPAKLLAVVNRTDLCKKRLAEKGIKFIQIEGLPQNSTSGAPSGTPEETHAWQELAEQAEGYSFVVLPDNIDAESAKKKCPLPVRTINLKGESLESILQSARVDKTLAWMEPLHEVILGQYRNKRDGWKSGDIHAFVAWESGDDLPIIQENSSHSITLHHVNRGVGRTKPFNDPLTDLPLSLDDHSNLGLAWVDHPNDANLWDEEGGTNGAKLRYAANPPLNRTQIRNWASVEAMFGDSPHTAELKKLRSSRMTMGAELAAAALARVVILDERIQSKRRDKVRSVTLYKYWPLAGIWCPFRPKDTDANTYPNDTLDIEDIFHPAEFCCDLDNPDFSAIQAFLKTPSKLKNQLPADYLVLHLTILEKLYKGRNDENLNQTLAKLVEGTACKEAEIVIVTGRGVPTAAHNHTSGDHHLDARYLPISALLEYLVSRPSKFALMRALWSAAMPERN